MNDLNIAEMRKSLKMTQLEFCDKFGISQSYLSEIENGKKPLGDELYKNILTSLGEQVVDEFCNKNSDDSINKRIQFIINEKFAGNTSAFCRSVDVKQPTMNTILGERKSKPSFDVISNIINAKALIGISTDWLISGKGEPFPKNEHLPINTKGAGVPYFEDIEASCSILSMNMDIPENPTFYIDYEHFNDCNAYIPVVGDSMYPQYCAGEIVAVKQIFNFDVIQWGEAYLVVTNSNANDLRTIKQIHYSEDESKIILRASNPNFKGDTKISKEDICSLFIIKGKIKRNQL